MIDLNKLNKKIDEDIENYENGMDSIIGSIIRQHEIQDEQIDRVATYLYSLTDEQLHSIIDKLLTWERHFEKMKMNYGIQEESLLFEAFIGAVRNNCLIDRSILSMEEDFLTERFYWKNYTFKLYQGQGSFWKILYNNEIIFQSY